MPMEHDCPVNMSACLPEHVHHKMGAVCPSSLSWHFALSNAILHISTVTQGAC